MAKKKNNKLKAERFPIPGDDREVDQVLFELGELQRQRTTVETKMNERLAKLKAEAETAADPINDQIAQRVRGLFAYCTAQRARLTRDGKIKTHEFGNGTVSWRNRPPSVSLRGKDKIIVAIKALGLTQFLRVSEDINKESMLADPDAATKIAGVKIGSAGEDFVVKPNHTALEEVADE